MISTRKIPVRINEKKHTTFSKEHLLPLLSGSRDDVFLSAKTGKTYPSGVVVYLGQDITPKMMLERYCQVATPPLDRETALRRLAEYCQALQTVKIGNVLSVSYSAENSLLLKVDQEFFLPENENKLP